MELTSSQWDHEENPSDVIYAILSDILAIPSNVHDSIQTRIYEILRKHNHAAGMEHPLQVYQKVRARSGYIDVVSLNPIRIGIEVDHSVPRNKSIEKLNFFKGDLSVIVLKGPTAGGRGKSEETARRCANFKTQYAVLNLAQKKMVLSGPVKDGKKS